MLTTLEIAKIRQDIIAMLMRQGGLPVDRMIERAAAIESYILYGAKEANTQSTEYKPSTTYTVPTYTVPAPTYTVPSMIPSVWPYEINCNVGAGTAQGYAENAYYDPKYYAQNNIDTLK